jgi:uncharacterized protein YdhG (YjbR/CyaY superfamily)
MAKVAFGNVDDYIDSQPDGSRGLLDQVRKAIRKAMPRAEEAISYNIPAYKLDGGVVIYFAGWKKHYSLYPVNEELVAAFREELATYEIDKGTIRFPLTEPVPVKLIERIAKFRARQTAAKKRRSASI